MQNITKGDKMDIFEACQTINSLISSDKEKAREELIKLLDHCKNQKIPYDEIINHLIRQLGLYPYLDVKTSSWQDKFAHEAFKVDVGGKIKTLHREQSSALKDLIDGKNLAMIAPTSFGKSFIIDAFIQLKQPANIVIIVPTISLTDETRRRLQKKFSDQYKIITTSEIELGKKNIFIFPQERALHYVDKIEELDMLVIDEFYKASVDFDEQRSTSLLNVILKLGKKAKQKYFLAPSISEIKSNPFTEGMEIKRIDFNTVFLNIHDNYKTINTKNEKKEKLLEILKNTNYKTLIYAGTFPEIKKLSKIAKEEIDNLESELLDYFSQWVADNYSKDWGLVDLIKKGTGIHHGKLHRSLSQIQIKLFSEDNGLKNIISTSSIIEGVNTSAKNVIFWGKKNGNSNLNYFGYKNLIGRGGRMLKHFIGEIYLLEEPPKEEKVPLSLDMPKELTDEPEDLSQNMSEIQKKAVEFHRDMRNKLGIDFHNRLEKSGFFKENDWKMVKSIIEDMQQTPKSWNGLNFLNSNDSEKWNGLLHKIKKLCKVPGHQTKLVNFTKIASQSWNRTIPELLSSGTVENIEDFFEFEKYMSFDLANAINCVNTLQKEVLNLKNVDISPFASKLSYAFLPKNVYLLEEYGLPRMISKKIQLSGLVNIENNDRNLHSIIDNFNELTYENVIQKVKNLDNFDKYILKYFFKGI